MGGRHLRRLSARRSFPLPSSSHKPTKIHHRPLQNSTTNQPTSPHTSATMSQSNEQKINERQGNLPLPEDPPVASDFNSADPSTVNVGSGRDVGQNIGTNDASKAGLREPASKEAQDLSNVGRQAVEGKLPKDAAGPKN